MTFWRVEGQDRVGGGATAVGSGDALLSILVRTTEVVGVFFGSVLFFPIMEPH